MDKKIGAHFFVFGYTFFLGLMMILPAFTSSPDFDLSRFDKSELFLMKVSQLFSVIVLFVVPAFIYAYVFSPEKISILKLRPTQWVYVGLVFAAFVAALPAIGVMAKWNSAITFPEPLKGLELLLKNAEKNAENITLAFLQMDNVFDLLINLIVIALAAAVSEEIFFRGVIQTHLLKITKNIHVSVWIASILFSALHGQFFGFFPRMFLGAMLGYFFVYSGSLWIPMIGHFLNNGIQVVITYFMLQTHTIQEVKDMNVGGDLIWLGVLSALVTIALMYFLQMISTKNKSMEENVLEPIAQ